jgi:hypothetical protein
LPPASFDPSARTVDVTWSTGAPVQRRDWATGRPFLEVLAMDPGTVDLSRLNAGAPVLNTHGSYELADQIGVVESAAIEGGQGRATLRLSERDDVAGIVADIAAGVIRNVSVGYVVDEWLVTPATDTAPETRTATRWTPYEISFVPIPADAGAQVRAGHIPQEDHPMPDSLPAATAATIDQLDAVARSCGLGADWTLAQLRAGATEHQARADGMLRYQQAAPAPVPAARAFIGGGQDHRQAGMRAAMVDALAARMSGTQPTADAAPFMRLGLLDMLRADQEARGMNTRQASPEELIRREFGGTHTTSDFPNLLQGTGQRFLLMHYARAQSPLRSVLSRVRTVSDFRDIHILRAGEAPILDKVAEGGEITHGTTQEGAETYKVATYAKIFSMSREAMINDDLQGFADFLSLMAAGAAETEARILVALLTANSGAGGNLADGNPVFHSSRANVLTGGSSALTADASGIAALGSARALMRKTTALDTLTPIAANPAFLLVSPDTETAADQVTTAITPRGVADANPFGGTITKLVEPRLSGKPWFLFADPLMAPVIEVAYLDASGPGPMLNSELGFDVLGIKFRAVLDFGAGLVGWRGAVRSAGA